MPRVSSVIDTFMKTTSAPDARAAIGCNGNYVGLTAAGPPTSGTHSAGDYVLSQEGAMWVCIQGGTPGTWQQPGANMFRKEQLVHEPATYNGTKIYPGFRTSPGAVSNNRMYAVHYPLSPEVTLATVIIRVTSAGSTGSTCTAVVFKSVRGSALKRIASSAAVATDSTGYKEMDLDAPVPGGQWIWVAVYFNGATPTPPSVELINYSPYGVQERTGAPDTSVNPTGIYVDSITSLPDRWPNAWPAANHIGTVPWLNFRFGGHIPDLLQEPDRYPVLVASEPTEQNCLQEPNVYYDPNRPANERYVMICTAGWTDPYLLWATAPTIDGPWTKRGNFWDNSAGKSSILFEDGVLYVYSAGSTVQCRYGSGPESLGSAVGVFPKPATAGGDIQNTHVVKIGEGSYVMMFECKHVSDNPTIWQTGCALGTSPLGPFTTETYPLTTLRMGGVANAMYGGPHLTYEEGIYKLWYHTARSTNSPTQISHATSTDRITWTPEVNERIYREHWREQDQCADPFYFYDPVSEQGYLFWDGLWNGPGAEEACIMRSNPNVMTIEP